jgi:hypothetical protein
MVNHPDRFYLISIANIFGIWLNGVDSWFKLLIRVEEIARYGFVKMTRFLI